MNFYCNILGFIIITKIQIFTMANVNKDTEYTEYTEYTENTSSLTENTSSLNDFINTYDNFCNIHCCSISSDGQYKALPSYIPSAFGNIILPKYANDEIHKKIMDVLEDINKSEKFKNLIIYK